MSNITKFKALSENELNEIQGGSATVIGIIGIGVAAAGVVYGISYNQGRNDRWGD